MACWQWTSSDRRFHQRSFRDSHRGSDAVLAMPGPSLRDAAALIARASAAGAVVIGANTSFPMIRPDVWIGCDHPECYDAALMRQPFPKFMGNAYAEKPWRGRPVKDWPNVFFLNRDKREPEDPDLFTNAFLPERLGEQPAFVWGWTFFTAIHLAAWMGCRRIYLAGVDLNVRPGADAEALKAGGFLPPQRDGAAGYADGRMLDSRLAQINRVGMSITLEWLPVLREEGRNRGYELIVTGEDSAAREHLPYVPLAEAVERIARRAAGEPMIAAPADGRVHGLLANQAQWGPKPAAGEDFGVVTGADAKTQWRLGWWYENLRRHYSGPVAFADFGMEPAALAWCRQHGTIINCLGTYLPGWFNKPIAMTRIAWRRAAWIDTDCEIVGEISSAEPDGRIFTPKYGTLDTVDLGPSGYAAAGDGFNPADVGRRPVNTGVVLFEHGCEAIRTWARAALTDPARARGDQELLNRLIDDRMVAEPAELPAIFNRLRLAAWDGSERIIHWTGPAGDSWIRRLIFAERGRAGEILSWIPEDRPAAIAEIGVLDGRTSRILLQRRPRLHVTMVDRWGELPNAAGGLDAPVTARRAEALMAEAFRGTAFAADRRRILRGDSAKMAASVADGSLDLVFIDADHSEAGCRRDIEAWAPKLRDGGILCGHDIDQDEQFPRWGVRAAVEGWMRENEYDPAELIAGKDHTWFIRTRGEPRRRRDEACAEEPAVAVTAG